MVGRGGSEGSHKGVLLQRPAGSGIRVGAALGGT